MSTALLAGAIYAAGPDVYLNTIFFSWRWAPVAVAFLLLALPEPKLPGRSAYFAAMGVLVATVGWTSFSWHRVNARELSGLDTALEAIPLGSRIIGLSFVRSSDFVPGQPFLQIASWATVLRGAETDFSFAEHGHALVRYRERRDVPWTRTRDMDANAITPEDYRYFDYALVHLPEQDHGEYASDAPVEAVTDQGRWRLYRVVDGGSAP